jgi:hybrid cluster-associated redox disulfide protein
LRARKDNRGPLRDPFIVNPASLLNAFVADVLVAVPAAARVFIDRRMGCVGCAFAPFETVAEVAEVYGIDARELANSLAAVASPSEEGRS